MAHRLLQQPRHERLLIQAPFSPLAAGISERSQESRQIGLDGQGEYPEPKLELAVETAVQVVVDARIRTDDADTVRGRYWLVWGSR